jgi:hypothetical protein
MPAIDGLAKLFEVKAGVNLRKLEISQYNQCTMAERVGFEPTVRLPVQRFSSSMILVPVRIAL